MAIPPSDRDLDFLLGEGRLPGPEKERIKEQLLASARAERRSGRFGRMRLVLSLGAGAAALALGAFLVLPRLQEGAFSVKGGGKEGAALTVSCEGASTSACPVGSTLLFVVSGARAAGFLGAYAEPEAGGERIWYFSAEAGAPAVAADITVPLRRGIQLGAEHKPGRYRIRLLLSRSPAPRAALLSGSVPGLIEAADLSLTVVPR